MQQKTFHRVTSIAIAQEPILLQSHRFMTEESNEQSKQLTQSKDPLHGKSLKVIMEFLYDKYGWEGLAEIIDINCFKMNPSLNSSLTFLRKTEWARLKVQNLYIKALRNKN